MSQSPPAAVRAALCACALLAALAACSDPERLTGRARTAADASAAAPVILVGAGDIAGCNSTGDERTAALIGAVLAADSTATVFTAGDNAYYDGTAADYANCYDPSWGQFRSATRPALGNHDYNTGTADGAFGYFGAALPQPGGYYSYDIGAWHIVVLNSNTAYVPAKAGLAQETWLRSDLSATTKACVLAIWHHPRFWSEDTGSPAPGVNNSVKPFWDDLYAAGAELVINGHKHLYERFAPQDPSGNPDPNGIREIIAGTGGKSAYPTPTVLSPNSEVRQGGIFGVLKLTLGDGGYSWEFVPAAGTTFTDSGSGTCTGSSGAGAMTANGGNAQTATVGTAVPIAPSVMLVDPAGQPASGVAVTFAAQNGGSVTGATAVTDSAGIAAVESWTLGTTAGANTLTATAPGYAGSPLHFTATGTPGPPSAAASTATVPNGIVGKATPITVQAKDAYGNRETTGGATVAVSVSGANTAAPPVTDNGNGTYGASYTPAAAGTDQVAITLDGTPIAGSPYTSTVTSY
ncbi:MAG TPA: filamin/ABP280 repeat domain-containing protein, partial [Gemmatimonadaceae bacterium]|nr:filamin/ABP280 repeat domain-containing protein [Gemmatimonadaceae bacterium]